MTTLRIIGLSVAIAGSAAIAAATVGSDRSGAESPHNACIAEVRVAVLRRAGPRNPGCWSVGPLSLGMTHEQIQAQLGPADAEGDLRSTSATGRAYHAAAYLLHGGPGLRVLQLTLAGDQLVRMTNNSPTISSGDCAVRLSPDTTEPDRDFPAYAKFDGIAVGDSAGVLPAKLGRLGLLNTSADRVSYWPTPLAFDIDPGRSDIVGFTVATNADALDAGAVVQLRAAQTPRGCTLRIVGLADAVPPAAH